MISNIRAALVVRYTGRGDSLSTTTHNATPSDDSRIQKWHVTLLPPSPEK